jgi:hypothetical protein
MSAGLLSVSSAHWIESFDALRKASNNEVFSLARYSALAMSAFLSSFSTILIALAEKDTISEKSKKTVFLRMFINGLFL